MRKYWYVSLVASLMAISAHGGWYFETTTKSEGGSDAQNEMMSSITRTWMSGPKMKSEFVESQNPMMPAGTFMITTNGGANLLIVNPAKKTYSPLDLAGLTSGAMKLAGGMMKITNPKVETLIDEEGGKLLGFPTHHYKFRTTYTMEMNIFGMKSSTQTETIQEIWSTAKINDEGMNFWKSKGTMTSGDESLDAIIKSQMDKIKGMPLKQIMINRNKDSQAGATETRLVMEVTQVKEQNIPASTFELPADFVQASVTGAGSSGKNRAGDNPLPIDPNALMEMMKKMTAPPAK